MKRTRLPKLPRVRRGSQHIDRDEQRREQIKRNQAAIELLHSWIVEDNAGDEQEQEAEWAELKAALNAARC